MPATYDDHTGNGSNKNFTYTYPVLKTEDVKVAVDGVTQTSGYTVNTAATRVEFTTAPVNLAKVRVYRETTVGKASGDEDPKAVFAAGSSIRAGDLNANTEQALFGIHELQEKIIQTEDLADDAVTSAKLDTNIDIAGTLDVTGATTLDSNATVGGTLGVTGATTLGSTLVVTGVSTHNNNVNVGGVLDVTGSTVLNGTLATGATNITGNIAVSGTVDGRDVAVDGAKLDQIEDNATADQTNTEIRAAVEAASDSNVFTDADHSKLNSIEDNATADQTASDIKSLIASSPLDASHLAPNSVTTSEIEDAELTILAGMQSGTASILAGGTPLTADLTELNLLDGKSIVTQIAANATDVQIPSAQAVNERITTVVSDVGGFVPIASETAFPTDNPDLDNAAGTIVSIKALGTAITTGSGVTTKTITNGAGSGKNVTITGLTQSTTYPAGRGMLLETTQYSGGGRGGDANEYEYTFHRLTLDEAGVSAAQAAIDDYDERYYGPLSSAPGSKPGGGSRANGDMYFDTTANKMKVFNATTSAWDDVATSASSFISTLSPAFDGSETEFTASSVPVDAQSAIISINGVIQKPNSGTSTPSEGYVQLANDKIKFATAPASGADYFMVTLGNAVSIGTPSNNTVSTAILQNDAVNGDKIADDAVGSEHIEVLDAALQFGDNVKAQFGAGNDLEIYHNGGTNYCDIANGQQLYFRHNGANKFYVQSGGAQFVGSLYGDDGNKIELGSSQDLQIYHDGTNNQIKSVGSGQRLTMQSTSGTVHLAGTIIRIKDENDSNTCATFDGDGAVELYHNNTWRLATSAHGVNINGDLFLGDNEIAKFGGSNDLQIYHNGSSNKSIIYHSHASGVLSIAADHLNLADYGNEHPFITCDRDGAVELYHDNVLQFFTKSNGAEVTTTGAVTNFVIRGKEGYGASLTLASDDGDDPGDYARILQHTDENLYFQVYNAANNAYEDAIVAKHDGAVELYYDNVKKFQTYSSGVQHLQDVWFDSDTTAGRDAFWDSSASLLRFYDQTKATFGNGDDLQIFHDGTNSRINSTTGKLMLKDDVIEFVRQADDTVSFKVSEGGSTELYHNHNKKFETKADQVRVFGFIQAYQNITDSDYTGNDWHTFQSQFNNRTAAIFEHSGDTSPYGIWMGFTDAAPDNNSLYFINCADSTTDRFKVYSDGDVWNHDNSYTGSDQTLKENIVDATSKLEDLKKLKVRNFNWKSEYFPEKSKKKQLGFIAQEVEEVFPSLVSEHDIAPGVPGDDHVPVMKKAIKQAWDPIIIKAMQELIAKVETLETKVAALEAK